MQDMVACTYFSFLIRLIEKWENLPIIIFNKNKISEAIVNEIISVLTAIEDKKKESDNEQTTDTAGETDF